VTGLLIGKATKAKLNDDYSNGTHLLLVMNDVDHSEEWEYKGLKGSGIGTHVIMHSEQEETPESFLERAKEYAADDIAFVYTVGQQCNIAYGILNYLNDGFNRDCQKKDCPGKARCKL
jgi:hypothetical protein